jgi:outer membrane protein assembly factor BamB
VRKGLVAGPRPAVLGASTPGPDRRQDLLLRTSIAIGDGGVARLEGGRLQAVACSPRPAPVSPPVVARLARANGTCVLAQDALNRIVCLESRAGQPPRRLWALPGRGISADAGTVYGVIAADLEGDGAKEVLFGRPGPDGGAQMIAARGDGSVLWTHDFPGFGGRAPVWNFNGLTHWAVGRFTGCPGLDVAVSLRRSTMHTDETHLLDGRTGREVWMNPYSKAVSDAEKRGFGGALTAALDVDGDGCEDMLCEYPDEYYVASGKTGRLILSQWASEIFPGGWLAYAVPVVGPFLEQGALGVLWTQGGYRRGMMTVQGARVWAFDYKDGYGPMPCLGDVNGDGRLEGLSMQQNKATCYDLATGKVRWTAPDTPQSADGVAADINGDGKDEFLFGSNDRLVALNESEGQPNLVWALPLPSTPGPPAVADMDGDGQAEIAVITGSGMLSVVAQAK